VTTLKNCCGLNLHRLARRAIFALCSLLLLCANFPCVAKDPRKDPLDKKVEALFDKAKSTGDQFEAAEAGKKLWDEEMNRVYQELKKKLSPAAATALQNSQRKWLEWRDSEFTAINAYYDQFKGTMYGPMRVGDKMDIIRDRTLYLRDQLSMLDEL